MKVIQTRTSSENVDDELVELCLACEPSIFRAVICRFDMGKSGRWLGLNVRHLRGRARNCGQCRVGSDVHLDGGRAHCGNFGETDLRQGRGQRERAWAWNKVQEKGGNEGVETMRAKYMRVLPQSRRAQDSVSEGHPNRARASHRMGRFRVISPTVESSPWGDKGVRRQVEKQAFEFRISLIGDQRE